MYFDIVVNGRDDRRRPRLDRDHAKEEELFAKDVFNEFSENDILRFMMGRHPLGQGVPAESKRPVAASGLAQRGGRAPGRRERAGQNVR